MAAVFLHDGIVCLWSDRDLSRLPMPQGVQHYTEFDEGTNTTFIAEFNANYGRFAFVGGVLQRDGVPVVFVAESNEKTARREIKDQINDRLTELQTIIDTVDASTNAQLRTMVKTIARNQRRILRLLKGLL